MILKAIIKKSTPKEIIKTKSYLKAIIKKSTPKEIKTKSYE